jgi:hypothetical protein
MSHTPSDAVHVALHVPLWVENPVRAKKILSHYGSETTGGEAGKLEVLQLR